MANYDVIVIGSGPGGYVAAIRASQLGFKTAVVEKENVGGICLNWGCIPTKALLKSAAVYNYMSHAENYGIQLEGTAKADLPAIVTRSRGVAESMSKGIQFLFKKNNIEILNGFGKIKKDKTVEVTDAEGNKAEYDATHIIIATGARSRELPNLPQDGKKIIGYREAMTLTEQPESMVVVGSGAIGSEFAFFYQSIGTKVTLVEYLPNILPNEDEEVSTQVNRSFKKIGMKTMTNASVESVDTTGDKCKVHIQGKKGEEVIECDIVLSAVGVQTNLENIGLEDVGIQFERGKIIVDDYYKTNVEGYYAIGDIVHGPALAHVASAEALVCVDKIAGKTPTPINYKNIPGCTYTTPEVASVGMTEKAAVEAGYEIFVGKFPFTASGKATAAGNRDGFIKVVIDKKTDQLLGCHFCGETVTEMISGMVVARRNNLTAHQVVNSIHPHPTMSEAIMEAIEQAYGKAVHL